MTSEPAASRLASYLGGLGVQVPLDRLRPETVAFAAALDVVARVAPEVVRSIEAELADQRSNLKLIAIESRGVELAKALFGSDHAYLQPHSGIDANLVAFWAILTARVEAPALERLGSKDLLSLSEEEWAGLRRDFGNQRVLGMALDAGGHLTHGFRPNISGKLFDLAHYSVDPETNRIDYDQVRER